ncbi:DUF4160 domain-containing protein [Spirosoma foliorum]|uniref:DUF4160 domain-containing protein n=1 Tax=Spirosoma foliorum TaxID=2710596 RepID=A0A7G5H5Y1_9BACT|nr:DUF4160 domain-containing protein [Spirosoma foliorum]QMW06523.1 DUF4160 domain-containing protein [Spirosoma foliorum]
MPVISMFYGLIVSLYYLDNKQHHLPHIHVRYDEMEAVFAIESGELLEGKLPKGKIKLVDAWIEENLMADWQLAINGQRIFPIDPLK